MQNLNEIASKHLGQGNSYAVYTDMFDPTLLVAMPRKLARQDWNIKGDEFVGCDTWHCHEATFLTNKGLPIAGTLKFIYSSDSQFMVESKSMKLYLNSFDMCKMGETVQSSIENYQAQVKKDLQDLLDVPVSVHFFTSECVQGKVVNDPAISYYDLYNALSPERLESVIIEDYQAKQSHLFFTPSVGEKTYRYKTNILRSRCRHTKQKDTGEALIYIKTKNAELDKISLIAEIASLREVNEFHEFCAEKLYTSIMSHSCVEECAVVLLYARRGSLDINPSRATKIDLIPLVMQVSNVYTKKQFGQ